MNSETPFGDARVRSFDRRAARDAVSNGWADRHHREVVIHHHAQIDHGEEENRVGRAQENRSVDRAEEDHRAGPIVGHRA